MIVATADTHALLWYLWNDRRLTAAARGVFESAAQADDTIAVSSISLVELVYLIEKDRVPLNACIALLEQENSLLHEIAVDRAIVAAMQLVPRDQIPDMPDRVIAATAHHLQVPLITRDHQIRSGAISTIW